MCDMQAVILDGKARASHIKQKLASEITGLKKTCDCLPRLAALQIGDDAVFSVYVNSQKRVANDLGIDYELVNLPLDCSRETIIENIMALNNNKDITGIILQSPLPVAFDIVDISSFISAAKDVEGINPENKGKLLLGCYSVVPPTASAVMELLDLCQTDLKGKEVVIIGHSSIVGKPLAMLLLDRLATVTVCHIETHRKNRLLDHIKRAEVLVVAVGKPNLVKGQWLKEKAIVIDVGINRVGGKIVGDVEFDQALERASHISPVPGGVGPLTTIILMRNCVELFKKQRQGI
jgi:methylenetetrahydrofolate dehydrogenase (NADP+) / methenyltetrahydrofolate cyclohydrolase